MIVLLTKILRISYLEVHNCPDQTKNDYANKGGT